MADYDKGKLPVDLVSWSVEPVLDRLCQIFYGTRRTDAGEMARIELRRVVTCLLRVHEGQWELEAACRAVEVSAVELGQLKRAIDESNTRRVACINYIDEAIREHVQAGRRDTLLWPLTVGQMVDYMLIAGLKVCKFDPPRPGAAETFVHLQRSFEAMLALVEEGSVTLPPASTIKDYGPTGQPAEPVPGALCKTSAICRLPRHLLRNQENSQHAGRLNGQRPPRPIERRFLTPNS
ncbi:MAG TPA: DUF4254 domain-containing protein, partial [Trebonia sp.]|nr:DUF4254 domain-containing protein [Trebonia sp.]